MKKDNVWQDLLKPVLVLLVICSVVAVLLGYVNSITAPIIEENALKKAEETRIAVLPGATSFVEANCDAASFGIDNAYKETSGLGFVITASYKGYGGYVTVTVGIDNDGKIVGLAADVSTETSGVGSKAGDESYINKFMGASGNVDNVDTITSATYSSSAVKNGVNAALKAYAALK